ncbi:hypothetical protein OROMI_026743 [Orobanche minor]
MILLIEPKHVFEILLPFSYTKYAITLMCEIAFLGKFDYRIKLLFKTWFTFVACTMEMVGLIREHRKIVRENNEGVLLEMEVSHKTPSKCNCVVMRDKVISKGNIVRVSENAAQVLQVATTPAEETVAENNHVVMHLPEGGVHHRISIYWLIRLISVTKESNKAIELIDKSKAYSSNNTDRFPPAAAAPTINGGSIAIDIPNIQQAEEMLIEYGE